MSKKPEYKKDKFEQSNQQVSGHQTNVGGDVNVDGDVQVDTLSVQIKGLFKSRLIPVLVVVAIIAMAVFSIETMIDAITSFPPSSPPPLTDTPTETPIPLTVSASVTPTTTPTATETPATDPKQGICHYAVEVRDLETDRAIADAKLTLDYRLDNHVNHTNFEGRYRGSFRCEESFPRYKLRIEAEGYQSYHTEFTLFEEIRRIYLVSTAVQFCLHKISLLDEATKARIADAEVQVSYGLYHATGYTTSDGYYSSELPCAEALPSLKVWVYADGYEPYNISYTLQGEIKEIRLPPAVLTATPTPTPTVTPTRFLPRETDEILILVADFWVSDGSEDRERIGLHLAGAIGEALADHPQVRVEYWPEPITPSDATGISATEVGRDPNIDATFVLWGYRVPKENAWDEVEVYLYLDTIQGELPIFENQYTEGYGPSVIEPSIFEFKRNLGHHWAGLTAFAIALSFYEAGAYNNADAFLEIASTLLTSTSLLATDTAIDGELTVYRDEVKRLQAQLTE